MEHVKHGIEELVGNTPLIELEAIEKEENLKARLLAKAEFFNPAGSVKDRVALGMIEEAEKDGSLRKGGTVIEPTSGNTGIGLAAVCAKRGYRLIIVMPDSMSKERILLMKAYGAELVLTPGKEGMKGSIAKAEALKAEIQGSIVAGQFDNPVNPKTHEKTTGPEILRDTDGNVDIFVAGVGTGGTISGVGRYLKAEKPSVKVIAVEPDTSAVLSGKPAGAHALQGIGAGFVPGNLDTEVYDEVLTCSKEEAYAFARLCAKREGLLVGISSGAALAKAVDVAKRTENEGKTVVVLFPDTGMRYLSTDLFEC